MTCPRRPGTFFTYATPHNGIDFGIFGLHIPVPQIAPFDAQIFNPKVMYQYLTPAARLAQPPDMPAGWDAHVITGLDPSRVFCLVALLPGRARQGGRRPGAGRGPAPSDDTVTAGSGAAVGPGGPPLTTVFLLDPARAAQMQREGLQPGPVSPRCRYSLQLKVIHLEEQHGLFTWQNHLEGAAEWQDTLIVDTGPGSDGAEPVWAAWEVNIGQVTSVPDPITPAWLTPDTPGGLSFTIPLPPAGKQLLGVHAALTLNVELLS